MMFRLPNSQKKNSKDPWGVIDGSWNNERLTFCVCTCVFKFLFITEGTSYIIYYTHSEITGGPCNLISSNWCDLFTNRTIFCFNHIFFPANEQATLKTKKPIRSQGLFSVPIKLQENDRQRVSYGKFCYFCFQNSYFFPPKNGWV